MPRLLCLLALVLLLGAVWLYGWERDGGPGDASGLDARRRVDDPARVSPEAITLRGRTEMPQGRRRVGPADERATEVPSLGDANLSADEVAILLDAEGTLTTEHGRSPEERAQGGGVRRTSNSVRVVRVAAAAKAPWRQLKKAIERFAQGRRTEIRLELIGGDETRLDVRFTAGVRPSRELEGPLVLVYRFRYDEGRLVLDVVPRGKAWVLALGCGGYAGGSWPWNPDGPPSPALGLFDLALGLEHEGAPLVVGVEVAAQEEAPEVSTGDVATLLAALVEGGARHIDLELRPRGGRRVYGSVDRGLAFLAAHASPSGAWGPDAWRHACDGETMRLPVEVDGSGDEAFEVGATGVALAAFLGAGYTNRGRHPHAEKVHRAATHLKTCQRADGSFGPPGQRWRGRNHALATLALTQLVRLTEHPHFLSPAAAAQGAMEEVWRAVVGDDLATGYAVLALEAERGFHADRSRRGEERTWTIEGRDAFIQDLLGACRDLTAQSSPRSRAIGCCGMMLLGGEPEQRTVALVLRRLLEDMDEALLLDPVIAAFGTLAAFRVKGETWRVWSERFRETVPPAQREGEACCLGGAWTSEVELPGSVIESTALYLLASEIYYRYDKVVGVR